MGDLKYNSTRSWFRHYMEVLWLLQYIKWLCLVILYRFTNYRHHVVSNKIRRR